MVAAGLVGRACGTSAGGAAPRPRWAPPAATGFCYGILFLMSILLYRNYFYRGAGRQHGARPTTATWSALVAVGYGCAALVTPPVTRRLTKPAFIALLLAASAVVIGGLGRDLQPGGFLVMGFCLGLAGQGIAICATTILQEEIGDDYRGRAFSLYDMMFNVTFVAGAADQRAVHADERQVARRSIAVVAVGYAVVAGGLLAEPARHSAGLGRMLRTDGGTFSPSAAAQRSSS